MGKGGMVLSSRWMIGGLRGASEAGTSKIEPTGPGDNQWGKGFS